MMSELTDEELGRIAHEAYSQSFPDFYAGDKHWDKMHDKQQRAARIAQGIAVREAVQAAWTEEREGMERRAAEFEQELATVRKERDEARDALRHETSTNTILRKQHAHHVEVLSRYFQSGERYMRFARLGEDLVDALPRMADDYESVIAERDALATKLSERACPEPTEDLIASILNDEFERESDGFLVDLYMLIRGNSYFPSEERTKMLAEIVASQRMYFGWMKNFERLAGEKQSLAAKLAEAEKTTPRPVPPRFDCTAEELVNEFRETQGNDEPHWADFALDYLSTRAVIDVPEGVPSADELAKSIEGIIKAPRIDSVSEDIANAVLTVLAPYLAAPVDPKLCEEALILLDKGEDDGTRLYIDKNGKANITHFIESDEDSDEWGWGHTPADAHRAGMWLLSFAAQNGFPVAVPKLPDSAEGVPDSAISAETLANTLQAYFGGTREAAIDAAHAVLKDLRYGGAEYSPIAPAETLEQLAEIALAVAHREWGEPAKPENFSEDSLKVWRLIVAAILNAAGAYVGATSTEIGQNAVHEHSRDFHNWLNSRIRFRVNPAPQYNPDDVAFPKDVLNGVNSYAELEDSLTQKTDDKDDLRERQRECYERVFAAACSTVRWDEDGNKPFDTIEESINDSHREALEAARTLPTRLAELDAALEEE